MKKKKKEFFLLEMLAVDDGEIFLGEEKKNRYKTAYYSVLSVHKFFSYSNFKALKSYDHCQIMNRIIALKNQQQQQQTTKNTSS